VTITVELVGEDTRELAREGTYGDLLAPFEVSRHEVTVLADGQPVPTDEPVADSVERVRVVRLIQGG
jgi:sulfur carrier protein